MAHLLDLCAQLPISQIEDVQFPNYLLGCFRRKSISFFNGLTDEETIVYWFQSRTFSIDLRLSDGQDTPICERQAWIGDTLWDDQQQLLSWHIDQGYQTRTQWPEPAKLYPIGNAVLEFSPSNAYVEDWRQQIKTTQPVSLLGLRLKYVKHVETGVQHMMDGGLIVCGDTLVFCRSRLPDQQQKCAQYSDLQLALNAGNLSEQDINSYLLSIALQDGSIAHSTQDQQVGQSIALDHFELLDTGMLKQHSEIAGIAYDFYFELDLYLPVFHPLQSTTTTAQTERWMDQEQLHLRHHATVVH
ncbi:hypothetical protein SAMN05421749_11043 [Acinetobacter marinus]|uniref:Uncharacterized protein n=1 Tax=Acinetobacter marinus TaxID=281375 RepID=A0A1G6NMI9_9GAMM|nr:hypothetical protein [Acinetobacter marinus]SDC68948.1 hypothetical protein SAMN05421749_11043 [Acinetobacter marinus]